MQVNLCAPFQDFSGYGEFARFFAYALNHVGVKITCENITLPISVKDAPDFGIKGALIKHKTVLKPPASDVNIVFMIPSLFRAFKRKQCKFNIGFTMFEADSLPESWIPLCNEMDAIIVPSEWNRLGFVKSGVTVPIFVVPAGIVTQEYQKAEVLKDEKFSFYSIFQWVERKNPLALIKAYCVAMQGKDDVQLVLKSYVDTRVDNSKALISQEIQRIRKELKLKSYPEIRLLTDKMTTKEISLLHQKYHVLVSPHRAEGWNMPLMEAMAWGNASIVTDYSGSTAFTDKSTNILLPYFLTPCLSTDGLAPFYTGDMRWAEPNMEHLISAFQTLYQDRALNESIGNAARKKILDNNNQSSSGYRLKEVLRKIVGQE